MSLRHVTAALMESPADLKLRALLATELDRAGAPESENVWRATATLAGGRGQFFIALALARRYLTGAAQDQVLNELARRYSAARPRNGPRAAPPPAPPVSAPLADDPDELLFQAVRLATDIDALCMPRFARVGHIPIFGDLGPEEFVALAREVEPISLEDGRELMKQDTADRAVYVLVRGHAQASATRNDGRVIDLGTRAGPTVLGEMALLTAVPSRSSVTALGPGLAWRIDAERLVELGAEQPALVERLRALVKQRLLADLLAHSEVLQSVSNRESVLSAFVVRSFGAGTEIFAQGAPAPGLFFVLYGRAEVWAGGHKVAELTEGDAFGEMSLLSGEPTTAAVRLPEGGITLHLSPEAFAAVRVEDLQLERSLTALMDVRRGELAAFVERVSEEAEADFSDFDDIDGAWALESLDSDSE